jgi:tRNA(Ile2) C34 agmatinyltransferase TiaS
MKFIVVDIVEKNSDMAHGRTEPGIVFFQNISVPKELTEFAEKTNMHAEGTRLWQ